MAVVAPYRGVSYNFEKIAHLEDVVTPHYDVFTCFFPKIMTDLLINKLISTEMIVLPE